MVMGTNSLLTVGSVINPSGPPSFLPEFSNQQFRELMDNLHWRRSPRHWRIELWQALAADSFLTHSRVLEVQVLLLKLLLDEVLLPVCISQFPLLFLLPLQEPRSMADWSHNSRKRNWHTLFATLPFPPFSQLIIIMSHSLRFSLSFCRHCDLFSFSARRRTRRKRQKRKQQIHDSSQLIRLITRVACERVNSYYILMISRFAACDEDDGENWYRR